MKRFLLPAIVASLFLFSCSPAKKSAENQLADAPEWVKKTPGEPQYYHGVGSAIKTDKMDYREKARQNAFSELAGNISVTISSTSVLNQYEFDKQFSDYYRDNIKLTTQNYLEGYELVEDWETSERYWVYYRLSKAAYEQVKTERLQSALSKSKGDYLEAERFNNSGNTAEAVRYYISAIEKIRDFLGENLKSDPTEDGKSYSSVLFGKLTSQIQDITIVYPVNDINVKRGQKPDTENLNVSVINENNEGLAGIPVITTYSYAPGRKDEAISDANGTFRIKTGIINTSDKEVFVSSGVNIAKMINESTSDAVVRKLLGNLKNREFILPVHVMPATFFVRVSEINQDQPSGSATLSNEISTLLVRDGFLIMAEQKDADYSLTVNASTLRNSERNGKFSSSLVADIETKDRKGQVLFSQRIEGISGIGTTWGEATRDACNTLVSKVRINILPDIYKQLFRD